MREAAKTLEDNESSDGEKVNHDEIAKQNLYEDNAEIEEPPSEHDSESESAHRFNVNYTVGRIEDGTAILLSKDHNLIEIPLCLLPPTIGPN